MTARKKEKQPESFEISLRRLEDIVEKLEHGDISLDDSINLYEEGVVLSKSCLQRLAEVETKLKRLGRDAEGNFELFDHDVE